MKYYCIGIKGTGMSTLAQILYDLGNEVTGYDDAKGHKFTQDGLEKRNIKIYYDGKHKLDKDTVVTYSAAFTEDHPEMKRIRNLGLKIIKYNKLMGDLTKQFKTIGVSGTHGKTTTTSLIKHILTDHFGDCNYFIGSGDGKANKNNEYFVVESDEFNRHFTEYYPTYSIITNIEKEHMECYKDIDDIRNTFEIFANNTKDLVVANGDNEEIKKINYKSRVIYYGTNNNNDVVIKNIQLNKEGCIFDLYINNELYGHFDIPLYGKHMVMNATAAIIICKEIGIPYKEIHKSLETFKNAVRRFQETKIGKVTIIDDYAHHPTEIKVTLEAVKQKYPDKELKVLFVPNTYSRTKDFKKEFVDSFKIADKTYLTEIDCNREDPKDYPGVSSNNIINELENGELISLDTIDKLGKNEQVVCFMGCAYLDGLVNKYKEYLKG